MRTAWMPKLDSLFEIKPIEANVRSLPPVLERVPAFVVKVLLWAEFANALPTFSFAVGVVVPILTFARQRHLNTFDCRPWS